MADVVTKAISGNNVKLDTAVSYLPKVTPMTGIQKYSPVNAKTLDQTFLNNVESRLTTRFDDPTYYTA